MKMRRGSILSICCIFMTGILIGCANMEYVPKRPVMYFHKELAAADRAVEAARNAGKDRECPEEFKAAEKMKNDAFDIYLSCRTMEGIAAANEAARRADALCSRKQAELPPKAALKPGKETVSFRVEFDFDKSDVKPKYHDDIARVAAYMNKHPKTKVTIEGHTDIVGGKAYNQKLSERRAESAKKYMVEKFGIDASRIATIGYGKSRPIADNKTEEGRQKNRRVVEATFR